MAESFFDVRALPKAEAYGQLGEQVASILADVDDDITAMATMASLLQHGFGHLWTGFYRVVEQQRLLRVGPYQGTLGCTEILFGRGVCGTAASEKRTVVVSDVNAFPGHISCDARAQSEIVVPVFDAGHQLIAVLDIDSTERSHFDQEDRQYLEQLVGWFARLRE